MFIKLQKSPTSTRVQVHLIEGYRDAHGRSRQRIIKNYGELSCLQANEPDVLDRLRKEAKVQTDEKKQAKVVIEVDTLRFRKTDEHSLNYGYFALEGIYRKLQIPEFLRRRSKSMHAHYNLDHIMRLLVFSRVITPCSKMATFKAKGSLFGDFECEPHDIYRALDIFDHLSYDLQLHLHKRITRLYGRDALLVFYDVTNYYFECDKADELRKKGASKEHRQDPIVQMGLLVDTKGIPICYSLFAGNTHDAKTLAPVLYELKTRYSLSRIVVVADKGINSSSNLSELLINNDGYIVSQKLRGKVDPHLQHMCLSSQDYRSNEQKDFAIKSFVRTRKLGSQKEIQEKVVIYWSKESAVRDAYKRDDLLPAVHDLINHPYKYEAKSDYGRLRYIKETLVAPSGEMAGKKLSFDEQRYENDLSFDGYQCIISSEIDMDDLEIVKSYRELSLIEDSFRAIKSDLLGRPVFVWSKEHINAHFLVCFIALCLMRIIQFKMGYALSTSALAKAIKSAKCTPLEKSLYVIDETDDVYKQVENTFGVSLPNRYVGVEKIKAYRRAFAQNS